MSDDFEFKWLEGKRHPKGKKLKGGPGSGHHGHTGIPGQVGGSAPSIGGMTGGPITLSISGHADGPDFELGKTTAQSREQYERGLITQDELVQIAGKWDAYTAHIAKYADKEDLSWLTTRFGSQRRANPIGADETMEFERLYQKGFISKTAYAFQLNNLGEALIKHFRKL